MHSTTRQKKVDCTIQLDTAQALQDCDDGIVSSMILVAPNIVLWSPCTPFTTFHVRMVKQCLKATVTFTAYQIGKTFVVTWHEAHHHR